MSVKTLKIKIISWQFLRFLLSYTVLFVSRENHRNNSFLHRFIIGKPNIHSIWISLNSSWTIFHDSYHLYNWCKIPVVFDYFFPAFCLCGVIETWRNRDWGKVSNFKTEKNDVFFKILLNECSFLTKGKYFMVVDILSQRLGQKFVMNMYVLKFRK